MKPSAADLKHLAVFRAVAEHHGYPGAQTALHMSQSAISFHIKALEERVGFQVCRRGRQGFELTDRGRVVYERAKALLAQVEDFDSEMGELRMTATGTLRLGLVDNIISDRHLSMDEVVREFLRKNHRARLDIRVNSPDELALSTANGDLQLAIVPEMGQMEGLQYRRVYTELHSLYCADRHPLFHVPDDDLTLDSIAQHKFVVRPYANQRELAKFPGAEVGANASNMEAQAMFILTGFFVGTLPDHFAKHWLHEGRLRRLMPDVIQIQSPFCVVSRTDRRPSLIVRNFIQELVANSVAHLHDDADGRINDSES